MAKRFVVAGSTGQTFNVFLQSTSNSDGVISMTTDKVRAAYKVGTTGAITTFSLVGTPTTSAWASGGWREHSSVEMPGVYGLDLPDAALATTPSVTFVVRCTTTSTNFLTVAAEVQVVSSAGTDTPVSATVSFTTSNLNQIADAVLDRNMATGIDSGSSSFRTPRQALRFLRNKWSISGTTFTVFAEDDTAASWTAVVTTNSAADPISAVDPA